VLLAIYILLGDTRALLLEFQQILKIKFEVEIKVIASQHSTANNTLQDAISRRKSIKEIN
jgi:hypothetical protein